MAVGEEEPMMKSVQQALLILLTLAVTLITGAANAEVTYFHHDAQGSVVAATDEGGALLWQESYQPYGERLDKAVSTDQHSTYYTGKPHDDRTGLTYFGARHYDPVIGRFMGVDPVGVDPGNIHSFNRYAYANNNPYKYVDPDGNFPFLIPVLVFIAKEVAAEAFERTTGMPALFSVKGVVKAVGKKLGRSAGKNAAKRAPCCFVAGTPVKMADGASKPIESIEIGDRVLSQNTETGELSYQPVSATFIRPIEQIETLYRLTVARGDLKEQFHVTGEHPFWLPTLQKWQVVDGLKVGDVLVNDLGEQIVVSEKVLLTEPQQTYNIEVGGNHTYFAGELGVLVHNCDNVTKNADGEWLSLGDAGTAKASDIKKAASDAFREATSGAKKQAHSGQGHKKRAAQASALEDFIKKNEKDFLPEYMEPIKREAKRMRDRASADKHK
jgi:RHS repeat-associated protein